VEVIMEDEFVTIEYSKKDAVYTVYYDSDEECLHESFKEENYASPDEAYLDAIKAFRSYQRKFCSD